MADIIDLRAGRSRVPHGNVVPATGARILFFTGVRYERAPDRWDSGPPASLPAVQSEAKSRAASSGSLDLAAH